MHRQESNEILKESWKNPWNELRIQWNPERILWNELRIPKHPSKILNTPKRGRGLKELRNKMAEGGRGDYANELPTCWRHQSPWGLLNEDNYANEPSPPPPPPPFLFYLSAIIGGWVTWPHPRSNSGIPAGCILFSVLNVQIWSVARKMALKSLPFSRVFRDSSGFFGILQDSSRTQAPPPFIICKLGWWPARWRWGV